MPIYEYRCSDCENKFEELVSRLEAAVSCPKCGSDNTSRLISMFCASGTSSPAGHGGSSCSSSSCSTKSCYT